MAVTLLAIACHKSLRKQIHEMFFLVGGAQARVLLMLDTSKQFADRGLSRRLTWSTSGDEWGNLKRD
jgi:hypothetical protein